MTWRRVRGFILRLTRRRAPALLVGVALAVPSAWAEFSGKCDAWWASGLSLVAGATGIALIWIGLTGASPDWVEPVPYDKNGD